VALLVQRGRDVQLVVAGAMDGWAPDEVHTYRAIIQARAARPDLSGRVHFLGWREDVDAVLQSASVHCCPSQAAIREAFGIVVVEAKRAGTPSVVCPSGALPELIEHRENGWITDGFDAAAIAEGLDWFLSDVSRLDRAGQAALRSAEQFSPDIFCSRWQALFGLMPRRSVAVSPHDVRSPLWVTCPRPAPSSSDGERQ
jgi:glycosyltransferase involved in cell wall biosynthesis